MQPETGSTPQSPAGLAEEIAFIRKLIEKARALLRDEKDINQVLKMLEKISLASWRLAALLKAQRDLIEAQTGDHAIQARIDRILAEDEALERRLADQASQAAGEAPEQA